MATVGAMRPAGVKLQKKDTHIERADQEKINQFSRLNMKFQDLEEQIKKLKEDIDNLTDANDMIFEVEDDDGPGALKLFLGEAFVTVDSDAATNYVEKVNEEKQEELDKKQEEKEEVEGLMKDLKSYLYARFGNSINLDEDK